MTHRRTDKSSAGGTVVLLYGQTQMCVETNCLPRVGTSRAYTCIKEFNLRLRSWKNVSSEKHLTLSAREALTHHTTPQAYKPPKKPPPTEYLSVNFYGKYQVVPANPNEQSPV